MGKEISWLRWQFTLCFVQSFVAMERPLLPLMIMSSTVNVTCNIGLYGNEDHYYLSVYFRSSRIRTKDLVIQYTDTHPDTFMITNNTKWLDGKSCNNTEQLNHTKVTCALWTATEEYYSRRIRVVHNKSVIKPIKELIKPYVARFHCYRVHGLRNLTAEYVNSDSASLKFSMYRYDAMYFVVDISLTYFVGHTEMEQKILPMCIDNCKVKVLHLKECNEYRMCINLFFYKNGKYTKCIDIKTLCLAKKENKDITLLKASISAVGGGLAFTIILISAWFLLAKIGICRRNIYPRRHVSTNNMSEEPSDNRLSTDTESINHIYQSIHSLVKKTKMEEDNILLDKRSSSSLNGFYQTVEQSGLNVHGEMEESTEEINIPKVFAS